MDILYIGRLTTSYGKKLINLAKSISPQTHIQPIPRPLPSIQTIFPHKDPLPKDLTSHVVYNISCKDCPASYIGKTFRQPERRFAEHGKPNDTLPISQPSTTLPNQPLQSSSTTPDPVRRSTRKKNIINYALYVNQIDDIVEEEPTDSTTTSTSKSAIH